MSSCGYSLTQGTYTTWPGGYQAWVELKNVSGPVATAFEVLMDLRGFSPANRGCVFELQALVNLVRIERLVLVVDRTTDLTYLRAVLDEAWGQIATTSPNVGAIGATLATCRLSGEHDVGGIRGLLASGLPESAHPFTGLVYRQALEHLHGVRNEAETRDLITRENRKYARRQLIWFRKEPNLRWFHAAGEHEQTLEEVSRVLSAMEIRRDAADS